MGQLYVVLADHGVLHCGVDFGMAKQALHLLNGHSLVNGARGQRPSEFMRMHFFKAKQLAEAAEPDFYAADFQAGVRLIQRHEQRGVLIGAAGDIVFQVNLGSGVKVNRALLVPLSEDDALPVFKVDVRNVQMHQLAHAHSGGGEHIDHGQVAQMGTAIPHHLHRLVGIGFLDGLIGADLVDAADRAFEDIVFVLQPCEKAGQNAANVVDIAAAAPTGLLVIRQILAQIVRCDVHDALVDAPQQLGGDRLVIVQRLFAAPLHALSRQEEIQELLVALRLRLGLGAAGRHDVLAPKRMGQGLV